MKHNQQKPVYLLVLLLLLFSASGCKDKIPALSKLSSNDVIVAFGDSLTYGTGVEEANSYPAVLQTLSKHTVINAGIPGELSAQGVIRLKGILDEHEPGLLILCHGGNDLLRKQSKSKLKQNLIQMINLAQQRDISVILVGVPEPKLAFMETVSLYKEIAQQFNIPVEMDIIVKVESDKRLKSDAIHPNAQGYQLIAEAIQLLLIKSGTI